MKKAVTESSSEQPLVSVVTPVYNTAPYLEACIRSVISQTYTNWEYVVADNVSTDLSLEIAREFQKSDPRIKVVACSEHVGQVENYNRALTLISPQSVYCKVVQADDWIFPECLEEMVAIAETYPSVAIVGSYSLKGDRVLCDGLPYPSNFTSGYDVCRKQLKEGLFVFGSPTSLLYRTSVVRSRLPFYNLHRLHEDTEACYEILRDRDFGFVHKVLTFRRTENESISSKVRDFGPEALDKFIIVEKYGRFFFDEPEFEVIKRDQERKYFRFLARRAFGAPGMAFWRYHLRGLRQMGRPIKKLLLAKYLLLELGTLVGNPLSTIWRFISYLKRKTDAISAETSTASTKPDTRANNR